MPTELLNVLPAWLVLGLAIGAVASVLIAGIFYFGDRLFPPAEPSQHRRIDGTLRRHAEIREYLRAIGEPFVEEYEIAGMTVAFYLPERDVAITYNARTYFRLGSTDTHVILCEDEMPVFHLGNRFPFEVPTIQRPRTPTADPVTNAYHQLGLQHGASASDVRSAYRSLVKEAHPDHGGSNEEFKRLREAYATAKDHTERSAARS